MFVDNCLTIDTLISMDTATEKIIGVRDLVRNTKSVSRETRKGISFVVTRNADPIFRIEPLAKRQHGVHTLADLLSIRFRGAKNLSKTVDRIVYGI